MASACGATESGSASSGGAGLAGACDAGVSPNPTVTKSTKVTMTREQFTADCDRRHGFFEIEPHCGGSNACRGMSYDSTTETLTEHSCRGTNTCAGYSCIVCD